MEFHAAQATFLDLMDGVDKKALETFLRWVKCSADEALDQLELPAEEKTLEMIKEDIRQQLPQDAIQPSEHINFPTTGESRVDNPDNTVHVDAFLYSESLVDALCDASVMSRNYCEVCGSRKTAPLNFITHSVSSSKLKYIFRYLLPQMEKDTKILDVGSRIGAVLYGAYFYSSAQNITGIEMNRELCDIQECVIKKFNLSDRIKITCADIRSQEEELKEADVIVLHNVFEFFLPQNEQIEIWDFLRRTVTRAGVFLVVEPSLEQTAHELKINFDGWTKKVDLEDKLTLANLELFGDASSEESDLEDLNLYKVVSN